MDNRDAVEGGFDLRGSDGKRKFTSEYNQASGAPKRGWITTMDLSRLRRLSLDFARPTT